MFSVFSPEVMAERLNTKYMPEPTSGCWLWNAAERNGYGTIGIGRGRMALAHRLSYELHRGPIPEGLTLDHLCRNTRCINPGHLEPVSMRENILRGTSGSALNAKKELCRRGHPLLKRKDRNARYCPICANLPRARRATRRYKNRNPIYDQIIAAEHHVLV